MKFKSLLLFLLLLSTSMAQETRPSVPNYPSTLGERGFSLEKEVRICPASHPIRCDIDDSCCPESHPICGYDDNNEVKCFDF